MPERPFQSLRLIACRILILSALTTSASMQSLAQPAESIERLVVQYQQQIRVEAGLDNDASQNYFENRLKREQMQGGQVRTIEIEALVRTSVRSDLSPIPPLFFS